MRRRWAVLLLCASTAAMRRPRVNLTEVMGRVRRWQSYVVHEGGLDREHALSLFGSVRHGVAGMIDELREEMETTVPRRPIRATSR